MITWLGDVPKGFVEVSSPLVVDPRGRPVGTAKAATEVFVRGVLLGRSKNVFPPSSEEARAIIENYSHWTLYGGPVEPQEVQRMENNARSWAFFAATKNEKGFWLVPATPAVIAPDGLLGYNWPWKTPRWHWVFERGTPTVWRVRAPTAQAPFENARWERAA